MGLQSFGWADGLWRTAPRGRRLADGPGGGVRQPADRHPDRRTERPSAIQPTVGAGDQRLGGCPPCRPPGGVTDGMPSGGRMAVRHAVRRVEWRTSVGLSDASGRPADADVDVRTRDTPGGQGASTHTRSNVRVDTGRPRGQGASAQMHSFPSSPSRTRRLKKIKKIKHKVW
jgi:hypothetical protein